MAESPRPPVNSRTGAEGRLSALVFNGLTHALTRDEFMPLSRRAAVADAIVELLMANGLEPKFRNGLDHLRQVSQLIEGIEQIEREANGG